MVDTMVLCSKGTLNGIMSGLLTAVYLKGLGVDTAVLFYQEAVAAFADRKFEFAPLLQKHANTILENLSKAGRTSDPVEMVKLAKAAGVPVYICGAWVDLIGARDSVPAEMEVITVEQGVRLVAESKKVVS
jgi:peroxiredoxin family protein